MIHNTSKVVLRLWFCWWIHKYTNKQITLRMFFPSHTVLCVFVLFKRGWLYATWMKSYNLLLWIVARIVWYKIVHVGDFILSLLILYLFFLSYNIYIRIPLYLGLRGGTSIFSDVFCAVRSIVFIRIHISCWFCSMGHPWILVRIHTNYRIDRGLTAHQLLALMSAKFLRSFFGDWYLQRFLSVVSVW